MNPQDLLQKLSDDAVTAQLRARGAMLSGTAAFRRDHLQQLIKDDEDEASHPS